MSKNYQIKRRGYELIVFEDCIESPREYYKDENIGVMVCFHHRLELGDENPFNDMADFKKWYNNNKEDVKCILPIFLIDNDHCNGNVSVTTDPIDERRISGVIGFIYCSSETLNDKGFYEDEEDEIVLRSRLEEEVEEYDNWLQNMPEYYSFEITDRNKNLVHCQGVFANNCFEDMIKEMKERNEKKEFNYLFDALLKRERDNCL